MLEDKYITIARYPTTAEAEYDMDRLCKAGVHAFISQDHALLEPIGQNENGNIKLNIRKIELENARKVIGK